MKSGNNMKIKVSDGAIHRYTPTENQDVFNRKTVFFINKRGYFLEEKSVKIIKQTLDGIVYEIEESIDFLTSPLCNNVITITFLENPKRFSKKRLSELFEIHVKGNDQ